MAFNTIMSITRLRKRIEVLERADWDATVLAADVRLLQSQAEALGAISATTTTRLDALYDWSELADQHLREVEDLADSLVARVAALEDEPEPEPEPPDLPLRWSADRWDDWDAVLTEDGTITDTSEGLRFQVPASKDRVRCEVQSHRSENAGCDIPAERVYEWELFVPSSTRLSTDRLDGYNTIAQFHTDEHCYTGGVGLRAADDAIILRVKGGLMLDTSGACKQTYEEQIPFGRLRRDTWHRVRIHTLWHPSDGFSIAYLDGVKGADVRDVPTCGDGATHQKFRLGWYIPYVPSGGVEMTVRNVRVYG